MTDNYKQLRDALENFNKYPWSDETRNRIIRAVPGLLAERDALESECAEQARLNGMGAEREAALLAQHRTDSKTLREYAKLRDDLRKEREALQEALLWNAGALQACCAEGIREASNITIESKTKCFAEILDMADAALAQEQGGSDVE